MTKPPAALQKQIEVLRKRALGYPETREDYPWGHSAFKVKDKAFVFLYADALGCSLSVKLPESNAIALQLPFAEPTGYGLGKSGWVSASFKASEKLPLGMLADWLDESYRAVAPKRVLAQMAAPHTASGEPSRPSRRKKTARKQAGANAPTTKKTRERARRR